MSDAGDRLVRVNEDKLCRELMRLQDALAAKDAEIERLRAIIEFVDTFSPDRLPTEREVGFDVEAVIRPPWGQPAPEDSQ